MKVCISEQSFGWVWKCCVNTRIEGLKENYRDRLLELANKHGESS